MIPVSLTVGLPIVIVAVFELKFIQGAHQSSLLASIHPYKHTYVVTGDHEMPYTKQQWT
jgi:hypothetical protein